MNAKQLVRGKANKGDLVAYEDMANPREVFLVAEYDAPSADYRLINDRGEDEWADLRQHGWSFVWRMPR